MIRTEGFISNFPWLWHTSWRENFVDIHFLYHFLLIPFTFLDLTYGAKISTVFFFAALTAILHFVLKASQVPRPWVWVAILVIGSTDFLQRMTLPRAPLVVLSFLLLGWLLAARKEALGLALLSFCLVWLYGGFTIFIALIACFALSQWILKRDLDLKTISIVFSGIAFGLILNPYFPENLKFLVVQTLHAGIQRKVEGGAEWNPFEFRDLILSIKELVLIFGFSLISFLTARKKPGKDTLGWFLFLLLTFLLTLNSRRFIEYLVPTAVISSALFFRDGWNRWSYENKITEPCQSPFTLVTLVLTLVILGSNQFNASKNTIRNSWSQEKYKAGALWLKKNTPGSIIYLSDWDDFPELFFFNSKNKYLIGLDPAFLYIYSEPIYQKWNEINSGTIKQDPYPLFKKMFKTPFIFTDLHHGPLIKLLNDHPRISLKYKDAHCRIYGLD